MSTVYRPIPYEHVHFYDIKNTNLEQVNKHNKQYFKLLKTKPPITESNNVALLKQATNTEADLKLFLLFNIGRSSIKWLLLPSEHAL
jgi:hypothetical protein